MEEKDKKQIKLWLTILMISIIVVSIIIAFTYKKMAYEKNKVETYIIYSGNYAYYYNNKNWVIIKNISFLKDRSFNVYNDNQFMGNWSINIAENPFKVSFSNGETDYYKLIGINSNKKVALTQYNYENITDTDISFAKQYLSSKNQTYFDGQTSIKILKMDIDADVILETIYFIRYTYMNLSYSYLVIKDGNNIETVLDHTDDNYTYTHKTYNLGLIIDADLNEKKEILIIENGYEYSRLLLYSNQYRTYSLVE